MKPIEIRMYRSIVRNAVIGTPFLALFALLLRGSKGAISSAVAVAVVLAIFALSVFPMAWASSISAGMVGITAMAGFFFRLVLVGVVFVALAGKPYIDRPSFAVAFMLAYLGLIAAEARAWIAQKPVAAAGIEG